MSRQTGEEGPRIRQGPVAAVRVVIDMVDGPAILEPLDARTADFFSCCFLTGMIPLPSPFVLPLDVTSPHYSGFRTPSRAVFTRRLRLRSGDGINMIRWTVHMNDDLRGVIIGRSGCRIHTGADREKHPPRNVGTGGDFR
jgi:hypothetical protein